jgi:integrase
MKKINGRIHYFGKWGKVVDGVLTRIQEDGCWQEALKEYEAQKEDLHAGRRPRGKRLAPGSEDQGLTVADLCNRFLTAKLRKQTSGELGSRMFQEYKDTTDLIVASFGKNRQVDNLAADDFEELRAQMAERWGPVRLSNAITRVRSVFKYGVDNGLLERSPRYGSEFRKPDKAVLRRHRARNGEKMLEADQLRRLIQSAPVSLRAMILLGINCGFGNHDCATLPLSALDLDAAWIDFPRPKTGISRRCPLWPETVAAMRAAVAERPAPKDKDDAETVFLLSTGRRWVRNTEKSRTDHLSVTFGELMKKLEFHRDSLGFYTLRHVFRTVADAARDPVAIDLIMGHADPSMGGHYRERVEDSRLKAVTEHVRQWLFGKPGDGHQETAGTESCDPSDPSDPPTSSPGSEGSQWSGSGFATDTRPTLRLYVG